MLAQSASRAPFVDVSDRFAVARPQYEVPRNLDEPSHSRPYGLRFLATLGKTVDVTPPEYTYDEIRQLAVDANHRPLHRSSEEFQRTTTGSSDGGSGPMEEWTYDK
jgi:putative ATP-grasp target RiPP